jgi:hypothetical protein
MTYLKSYNTLKNIFDPHQSVIHIPGSTVAIHNLNFTSDSGTYLPGAATYHCDKHNIDFSEELGSREKSLYERYPDVVKHPDLEIEENREFTYTVFENSGGEPSNGFILLFHGLNEKFWDKYHPWAVKLAELTNKTVVLFPIAFHMNRSPSEWGNSRLMNRVAKDRQEHSYTIMNATFANAAISARIQTLPQRFFWSGLQTFFDVVKFIRLVREGSHPLIRPDAHLDLFSYSIGSFLSEILLMANPSDYFSDTRLFVFCGGPTLDRMRPNSKFILDSDATIALYSFYTERLEMEMRYDKRLAHFFLGNHSSGNYFKSMLNYHIDKERRERRLRELQAHIKAVALKNDMVIPSHEVTNVLKGENRDIPIEVDILDFPFPYDHVTPFSPRPEFETVVDESFQKVFRMAADFLK